MGDMLDLDDIHLEFAPDLVDMVLDPGTGLDARIANMRNHVATEFGVLLPEIRLTDNAALSPGQYVVKVLGVEQVRDSLRPEKMLALLSGPAGRPCVLCRKVGVPGARRGFLLSKGFLAKEQAHE